MSSLTDDYGIEQDERYAQCNREAKLSLALFIFSAATSLITAYAFSAGRGVDEYGVVLGMPSWLFISIVVSFLVFLVAVALALRFVFRDVALDAPPAESHDISEDRS